MLAVTATPGMSLRIRSSMTKPLAKPVCRGSHLQVRASVYKGGVSKKKEVTTEKPGNKRSPADWEKSNAYQVVKGEPVVAQMDFVLFFLAFGFIFLAPVLLPPLFEILKQGGVVDVKEAMTGQ